MLPQQMSPDMPAFSIRALNSKTIMNWRNRIDTVELDREIKKRLMGHEHVHFQFTGPAVGQFSGQVIEDFCTLSQSWCNASFNPSAADYEFGAYTFRELCEKSFESLDWPNNSAMFCLGLIMLHRALILQRPNWYPGTGINISLVGIAGLMSGPLGMEITI